MSALMDDTQALAAWAEPNSLVLNDARAEAAVLRSLDNRGSGEAEQPYLRPCAPGRESVPLLDAMLNDHREYRRSCDRCSGTKPSHRLWVVCGESVAELACCGHCRRALDASCGNRLVWR